jgi:ubiquinone/menaquinone biosynthesis C-methylase UbiE
MEQIARLNEYINHPKNQDIEQLRRIFIEAQILPKTEAEEAYAQKSSKHDPASALNNVTIKELLAYHWGSYNHDTWRKGMDNIAGLLRLETCQTVYEAGFGSGAPLSYFNAKYPELGVSGNDFYEPFVQLAKNSKRIGNGAFVHTNSQHLDFIPDNTLDAVFAWGSIGYEDQEGAYKVFKELIRICKHGGRILIGNMDNSEDPPSEEYNTAYQTSFSKQELEKMMKEEPVKIIELSIDKEVIGIEGHLADSRLTICMEKN